MRSPRRPRAAAAAHPRSPADPRRGPPRRRRPSRSARSAPPRTARTRRPSAPARPSPPARGRAGRDAASGPGRRTAARSRRPTRRCGRPSGRAGARLVLTRSSRGLCPVRLSGPPAAHQPCAAVRVSGAPGTPATGVPADRTEWTAPACRGAGSPPVRPRRSDPAASARLSRRRTPAAAAGESHCCGTCRLRRGRRRGRARSDGTSRCHSSHGSGRTCRPHRYRRSSTAKGAHVRKNRRRVFRGEAPHRPRRAPRKVGANHRSDGKDPNPRDHPRVAHVPQRCHRRAGEVQRFGRRRPLRRPRLHRGRAVPGRAEEGPRALQGPDQLPDARPARQPVRAQLDDLLHQRPDLRLPRVHAAPGRLVVQRGVRPLPGAPARLLRPGHRPQARAAGPPRQVRLRRGHPGAARRGERHPGGVVPAGLRVLPEAARRGRRPRGRPLGAARRPVLLDVRHLQRALPDALPRPAHPARAGQGAVLPAAGDRDGGREDGGPVGEAHAADVRRLQRQRARGPLTGRRSGARNGCTGQPPEVSVLRHLEKFI
ncbi:hypothetical protein SGPA1_11311 [Streptomyces misionensis JCM 4497]